MADGDVAIEREVKLPGFDEEVWEELAETVAIVNVPTRISGVKLYREKDKGTFAMATDIKYDNGDSKTVVGQGANIDMASKQFKENFKKAV